LISPEALYATKRAVNRGADAAGIRAAISAGRDVVGALHATRTEFGRSSVKWSLPKVSRPQ
jgi:hypothetical protein